MGGRGQAGKQCPRCPSPHPFYCIALGICSAAQLALRDSCGLSSQRAGNTVQTGKRGQFGLGLERIAFSDQEQFSFHLHLVIPAASLTPASASAGIFLLPYRVMESFRQPLSLPWSRSPAEWPLWGWGCRQVAALPGPFWLGTTDRGAGDSGLH